MRFVQGLGARGLTLAMLAVLCAHCGSVKGAGRNAAPDAGDLDPEGVADAGDTDGGDGVAQVTRRGADARFDDAMTR